MSRFVPLAAAVLALGACHVGANAEDKDPGPKVNRNYNVAAFDRIEVAGPYDVKVVTGGKAGISASGNQRLLDKTDVVVEDGVLKILPKKKKGMRWGWTSHGNATFTVTTAALKGAAIAGSGGIAIDKVAGDFDGEVAGSGDLRLASVAGGKVKLAIAGSGDVQAAGKADSVDIEIAGSGGVDAKGLATRTASVSIAGSGSVSAQASDTADVSIMGSGDVEMTGGAKCKVSKAGSGDVRCS
jgi:hypothetical protein